jgi:alcohol dehydrogenase class IV
MIASQKLLPERLQLPARTVSRPGALLDLFAEWGCGFDRCLVVHGRALTGQRTADLLGRKPAGMDLALWQYKGNEPTVADVEACLDEARRFRPDWIVGIGGGSVLDVAKACAGLLHAERPVEAYHDGAALPSRVIPYAAVPTTAGTGTEATNVTVLTNRRTGVKKSFRHPSLAARLVVLDPSLLATCPPETMAASGMDALVQAIESFLSRGATRFTDLLALDAVRGIHRAIVPAWRNPADLSTATDLLQGSFLAGCALSNARLGLVHGLAHPLGARFGVPHGAVCGVCMPAVLRFNRPAAAAKFGLLAEAFGGDPIGRTEDLLNELAIRSPFRGARLDHREAFVDEVMASGSTAANPRTVTRSDVSAILDELLA